MHTQPAPPTHPTAPSSSSAPSAKTPSILPVNDTMTVNEGNLLRSYNEKLLNILNVLANRSNGSDSSASSLMDADSMLKVFGTNPFGRWGPEEGGVTASLLEPHQTLMVNCDNAGKAIFSFPAITMSSQDQASKVVTLKVAWDTGAVTTTSPSTNNLSSLEPISGVCVRGVVGPLQQIKLKGLFFPKVYRSCLIFHWQPFTYLVHLICLFPSPSSARSTMPLPCLIRMLASCGIKMGYLLLQH